MTSENNDSTFIVCSVISGDRLRVVATSSPKSYLENLRKPSRHFDVVLPVSVFPTYRSRFEMEAGLLDLPAEPSLAYVARWLFKAPIVSEYQLPVYHYITWARKEHPEEFQGLWQSYIAAAPAQIKLHGVKHDYTLAG